MIDKRLIAQAIQTKRDANPPHFEIINCTLNGLDTPEGKDRLDKLKADAVKAHPLQEVNFVCLVLFSDG